MRDAFSEPVSSELIVELDQILNDSKHCCAATHALAASVQNYALRFATLRVADELDGSINRIRQFQKQLISSTQA